MIILPTTGAHRPISLHRVAWPVSCSGSFDGPRGRRIPNLRRSLSTPLSRRLIADSPGTTFAPSRDVPEPIHPVCLLRFPPHHPLHETGRRVSGHHRRDKVTGTASVAISNAMPEEGRCDRPRRTPLDAGTGESCI